MARKQLRKQKSAPLSQMPSLGDPDTKALIISFFKLQMLYSSKLLEFIRDYQKESHWGRDRYFFTNGSGGKTRVAKLFDQVNNLGVELGKLVSVLSGEQIFEKRDNQGRVLAYCNRCKKETPFKHFIDSPYGLGGAYMAGSERLRCDVCKEDTIHPGDKRLPKFNSVFQTE